MLFHQLALFSPTITPSASKISAQNDPPSTTINSNTHLCAAVAAERVTGLQSGVYYGVYEHMADKLDAADCDLSR